MNIFIHIIKKRSGSFYKTVGDLLQIPGELELLRKQVLVPLTPKLITR